MQHTIGLNHYDPICLPPDCCQQRRSVSRAPFIPSAAAQSISSTMSALHTRARVQLTSGLYCCWRWAHSQGPAAREPGSRLCLLSRGSDTLHRLPDDFLYFTRIVSPQEALSKIIQTCFIDRGKKSMCPLWHSIVK